MKFADSLRNIKPLNETDILTSKIEYICKNIYPEEIKRECYKQAQLGRNVAKVEKSFYKTELGISFSVDFEKKSFFKIRKSDKESLAERIVQETLGNVAKDLGLKLISVRSVYSSIPDARSTYDVVVTFSW
ncbi:hypothetical protein KFE17_00345 [Faecalicatena sp. Marseille-Q4148]|nr:hypothetical protein KFE17_00345 [Faecalicatena sp. Marseille-Q4148]